MKYFSPEMMESNVDLGERIVSKMNTVLHCHHYNSRLQNTIESSEMIQGKSIIRNAAALTFEKQVRHSIEKFQATTINEKLTVATELYCFLGFGVLNLNAIHHQKITSTCSHFVEGWKSGFRQDKRKVCTFVEGYLEGALHAVYNLTFQVEETACMNEGADMCSFSIKPNESSNFFKTDYIQYPLHKKIPVNADDFKKTEIETAVDFTAIKNAVSQMPLFGNQNGIIPAFNVYLAHMPRDFYNLACLEFMKQMKALGFEDVAHALLEDDAETCALNTFAGIMQSEEWAALIEPMITNTEDNLYALIAVSNALGWGLTHIASHTPYQNLELRTANGYEALGTLEIKGIGDGTDCPMLSGVAAGLMALVYGNGDFECRKGAYKTTETLCISKADPYCAFSTVLTTN